MEKLTSFDRASIVRDYTELLEPTTRIAARLGISRQHVANVLRKAGVKRTGQVTEPCAHCGSKVTRYRSKARLTRSAYCNSACYHAKLGESGFVQSRQGQRLARSIVASFYPLSETEVVHHIDSDQTNNDVANLMVFASHAEHMRWHRLDSELSGVVPRWRGDRND